METRTIAIMLTDIKGFTSKTSVSSRAETHELLTRHRELVLPVIQKFGGRLVKTIGDAFLAAFNSPTDAVICGVEIQAVLKAHNEDKHHSDKIEIRIAINAGEVSIHDDGDIYGEPVNITARLESIAEPGEVFFTEAVYLSMNKKEVPSSEIGYRQFKGIPEKIKVFRVLREVPVGAQPPGVASAEDPHPEARPAPAAPPAPPSRDPAGFWRRLVSLLLDVTILLIVLSSFGLQSCGPRHRRTTVDHYGGKDLVVNDVSISKDGISVKSDGNVINIGASGGPGAKYTRTTTKSTGFDTGMQADSRHVPLKMLIWVLYCGVLLWRFSATPGMMILKLKAVDLATDAPLAVDKAFLRAFFSLVSLFLLLGYIWAIWEKDRRTWHDIIAGSRIIKA